MVQFWLQNAFSGPSDSYARTGAATYKDDCCLQAWSIATGTANAWIGMVADSESPRCFEDCPLPECRISLVQRQNESLLQSALRLVRLSVNHNHNYQR